MLKNLCVPTLLMHTVLLSTAIFVGCGPHVYRVYDPYYADYHVWGPDEGVYYHRWLAERHYEYRNFRQLDRDRQKEYWTWRHSQTGPPPRP